MVRITGNTYQGMAGDTAITLNGGTVSITGETISGAATAVDAKNSVLVTLDGNTFTGNTTGVLASGAAAVSLSNTTFDGSTDNATDLRIDRPRAR